MDEVVLMVLVALVVEAVLLLEKGGNSLNLPSVSQHNAFTPELRQERLDYRLWAATIARTRLCFIDEVSFIFTAFFSSFLIYIFFLLFRRRHLRELHWTAVMRAAIPAARLP